VFVVPVADIGSDAGTTTNINVGGNLNLYTPIMPKYGTITLTTFDQIGYSKRIFTDFAQTFNSAYAAFCPNPTELPQGIYHMSSWYYSSSVPAGSYMWTDLLGKTSVITAGDTTGWTNAGFDGGAFPPSRYVLFNRRPNPISGEFEQNTSGIVTISTYKYVAIGISSSISIVGGAEFQITRIA
jgi:hypothetical protein